jgi:hypothetical protein
VFHLQRHRQNAAWLIPSRDESLHSSSTAPVSQAQGHGDYCGRVLIATFAAEQKEILICEAQFECVLASD